MWVDCLIHGDNLHKVLHLLCWFLVFIMTLSSQQIINWEKINSRLPFKKTPEQFEKRKMMWRAIDVNDNGFVSLAEVTRGVRDVIDVDELFECRPAINAAFHHSKSLSKV